MEYVYGVLLLHKTGQEINEANLKKVVAATGVSVDESKVKSLIASLKGVNIDEQLANATLAVAAPASGSAPAARAEAPKEEEKSCCRRFVSIIWLDRLT